jgi:hypothetical protein
MANNHTPLPVTNHSRRFYDLAQAEAYIRRVERLGYRVVLERRRAEGSLPVYVVRAMEPRQ